MAETIQNLNGYNPSPYSLQEIRVITGNADAEYGNVDGAEIIMVSKAGTNNLHGSAFEYFENQNMGANSWGNDYSGLTKTKFHQHQCDANLCGRSRPEWEFVQPTHGKPLSLAYLSEKRNAST